MHRITGIIMATSLFFGLFRCGERSKAAVTSVESVSLTLHGMRGSSVYEITGDAEKTELSLYRLVYSGKETVRELEKSVVCDTKTILEVMNTCRILRWDGFHGKHPKHVSDGIMFRFMATVNGSTEIRADGSANFPKGYHEFVRALNQMLTET